MFIPVLYICVLQHCEFMQQNAVYEVQEECLKAAREKASWFIKHNVGATVDQSCIEVPIQQRSKENANNRKLQS